MRSEGTAHRPTSTRKLSWDALRAFTILLVLLFHSTSLAPQWHPELGALPFTFGLPIGASTLLIVSGYFAAGSLHRHDPLRWWFGRLARMLPAFWAGVLLTSLVMRAESPAGWWMPSFTDVGSNLLMLWQWKPQTYAYVDASYWTLPVQLTAFTVLLAVMRYGRTRPPAKTLLWTALAVEAALWPIRVCTSWEPFRMFHDGLGWHRMHLVVIGVAIHLVATGRLGRAQGAVLVGLGLCVHGVQTQDPATAVGVAVLTTAVWATAVGPDWSHLIPAFLHPGIRWLAGISYGIYLTHQSVGYLVMGRLHGVGAGPWIQVPAMLATGLLLGWLLTATVERPAYGALTRLRDRHLAEEERGKGPETRAAKRPTTGQARGPAKGPVGEPGKQAEKGVAHASAASAAEPAEPLPSHPPDEAHVPHASHPPCPPHHSHPLMPTPRRPDTRDRTGGKRTEAT